MLYNLNCLLPSSWSSPMTPVYWAGTILVFYSTSGALDLRLMSRYWSLNVLASTYRGEESVGCCKWFRQSSSGSWRSRTCSTVDWRSCSYGVWRTWGELVRSIYQRSWWWRRLLRASSKSHHCTVCSWLRGWYFEYLVQLLDESRYLFFAHPS